MQKKILQELQKTNKHLEKITKFTEFIMGEMVIVDDEEETIYISDLFKIDGADEVEDVKLPEGWEIK